MKPSHTPQTICKFLMNAVADGLKIKRQKPKGASRKIPVGALAAKVVAIAGILCGGAGATIAAAASTNDNWTATSAADYSVSSDWSSGFVPNGVGYYAIINNNNTCSYTAANDVNNEIGGMFLGTNTPSTFNMTGGTLWITNTASQYLLTLGGGSPGVSGLTPSGAGGNGTFNMSGGTLLLTRASAATYHQDAFILGITTNSTGTFTLSSGTATFLCGIEIGTAGAGIMNVSGGTLIANSWFHIGQGFNSSSTPGWGSGTYSQSGGTVYILPNTGGGPGLINSGFCLNNGVTNAMANISGGTLYCVDIGLNGTAPKTATDTLNISGGVFYVGGVGVISNENASASSLKEIVNISGGTFHTVDFLVANSTGSGANGVNGAITNILADGTNWTWAVNVPVNLTNTSFQVNGTAGPGYVTFAPEATRTITLSNVWSGSGGLTMSGPGSLAMVATNTYSGPTVLSGGRINLNAVGTIADSSSIQLASGTTLDASGRTDGTLTLASGQTLTGVGTVNGAVSVGSGAMVSPGTSSTIGTLNNTGSTLFQSGSTLTVKVQNAVTGAGVGNDEMTVSGNIGEVATMASEFTVKLVSLDGAGVAGNSVTNFNNTNSYTWTIATGTITNFNASTVTVDTSSFGNALAGGQFFADSTGNSLVVYYKPATSTVGGTGPSISSSSLTLTNGNPIFSGFGVPTYLYGVESATSLTGPWIEAGNTTAGSNGSWSFTDLTQTNPSIFYRIYYPDNPSNPPQ